jgi:uncharacterized protein YndB with AHSA1/START domain
MSTKTQSTFSLQYAVKASIAAPPSQIWGKLTDAKGFPSWNSTVERIDGEIALGQKLAIAVPIAPGRTFSPKVVEFIPEQRMVWRDGFAPMFQGTRTFTLTPNGAGTTFEMVERLGGLMLPMIKGSLPDFAPVFDQYVADLKAACEKS